MCITLSQPTRRPTNPPLRPHMFQILGLIGALFVLVMTTACDRVEIESDYAAGIAGNADNAEVDTPGPTHFEWPEDTSHPTLTLEIENGSNQAIEKGKATITIELMPELAPVTVAHVIKLAKEGYYDGTTFHRVIPGFMIQGGDPNSRDRDPDNDGDGNPDFRMADEFGDAPFVRGVVGMGNLGRRNSTGSQFFIMHDDNRSLDGRYTVIGRVVSGIEIVDAITLVPIDRIGRWGPKDRPIENVLMRRVAIQEHEAVNSQITHRIDTTSNRDTDS